MGGFPVAGPENALLHGFSYSKASVDDQRVIYDSIITFTTYEMSCSPGIRLHPEELK